MKAKHYLAPLVAIAVGAALAFLIGCSPAPSDPTPVASAPTCSVTVTITGNGATTVNACGNTVSTNPKDGDNGSGAQVVYGVKIGEFGEVCPDSVTAGPAESEQRQSRVGCNSAVTASPTDANGSEVKRTDAQNFVQLVSFKQISGAPGTFSQDGDNAFNGHVACKAPGNIVLRAEMKDLATGKTVKGGNGGNDGQDWTITCVG